MSQRLSDEDSRAVDLLLDRSNTSSRSGNGNGGSGYVSTAPDELRERMRGAEKLLQLLAEMPATDPPSDLVRRTLGRIEQHEAARAQKGAASTDAADESRPSV